MVYWGYIGIMEKKINHYCSIMGIYKDNGKGYIGMDALSSRLSFRKLNQAARLSPKRAVIFYMHTCVYIYIYTFIHMCLHMCGSSPSLP